MAATRGAHRIHPGTGGSGLTSPRENDVSNVKETGTQTESKVQG